MKNSQKKNWHILPKTSDGLIKQFPEYNQVVLQLLFNRGIIEKNKIEKFLGFDYEKDFYDSFLFIEMDGAVELVIKHIKEQNKIVIYGDYDADGVTSSVLLVETLKTLKAKVEAYIPNRVSEGYGLNKKAIDELKENGTKLIITVDNGIRSKEEIEYTKSLGMEVLVTDHHVAPEDKKDWPDCIIIDPIIKGEKYPYKYLAGVGVAFKLAKALISKSKLNKDDKNKLEDRILDLVAIGTVADCVSLSDENRILVKKGLEILNKTKRKGLIELMKTAKIPDDKEIDAWNIGFQIAPRINAAGRMDHANTAFELLITKNKEEAIALSKRLNEKNIDRQDTTKEITEYVDKKINKKDKIIISVCPKDLEGDAWNEGVIGLVAGRICQKYYRPTLVITRSPEGFKGSGRSIEEFNMMSAIEECSEFLDKFGGHAMACGFSLSEENLEKFKKKIKKIAEEKLKDIKLEPKIIIEKELDILEVNEDLIKDIEKFAPFGQENNQPIFLSSDVQIRDIMTMGVGGKHIKFRLNGFWALGFNMTEEWKDLRIGDKIDIAYYVEMNNFNGRSEVQLKIVDIKYEI